MRITAYAIGHGMCRVVAHAGWWVGQALTPESEKIRISLSRTRSTIRQLMYCNNFELFVTFTASNDVKGNKPSRESVTKQVMNSLRRLRRTCGISVRYLLVSELSEDGRWHIHGLFGGLPENYLCALPSSYAHNIYNRPKKPFQCYYIPILSADSLYCYAEGIVSDDGPEGLAYLQAYLCKTLYPDIYPYEPHVRRYHTSRNLLRPDTIYDGDISVKDFKTICRLSSNTQTDGNSRILYLPRQDAEAFLCNK